MLSFWVFAKDFLLFFRSKQTFFMLILMPLLLIAILGAALSGMVKDNSIDATLSSYTIAVVDEDQSEHSQRFINEVLIEQLSTMLTIKQSEKQEISQLLKDEIVSLALVIPQGFGEQISQSLQPQVDIVTYGEASIEQSILSIALMDYQNITLGVSKIVDVMTKSYMDQGVNPQQLSEIMGQFNMEMDILDEPKVEKNTRMGEQTVSSFQYYAVAMGVMYLIITVTILVGHILTEKEEPVYLRQFVSNLTPTQYLLGKYLGLIVIVFFQLTITVVGTALLFRVDWGNSIISIIFTMVTLTFSISGLGLVLATFVKKSATYNNLSMIGTQILSALGGSFMPIYFFPDWMLAINAYLPNAIGLRMFLDVMTGGTLADIWQQGVITIVISIVLFAIAWIRLARKGGGIHV